MEKGTLSNLIAAEAEVVKQRELVHPLLIAFARKVYAFRYPKGKRYYQLPYEKEEYRFDCEAFVVSEQEIRLFWTEYHCGEANTSSITFPTEFLFMEDEEWHKKETERQEKAEQEKKRKNDLAQKQALERQRLHDEEEFEKLRIKLKK